MQHNTLVGLIYEAAADPDLWIDVLDRLADIAGAEGGLLFAAAANSGRRDTPRYVCTPSLSQLAAEWVQPRWLRLNIRDRLFAMSESRFLTDLDAFTTEELDRSPFYAEFLWPRGFGWTAATAIHTAYDDTIVFALERAHNEGPVESERLAQLNALQPHLSRAALLAARLAHDRARAAAGSLDSIGVPGAILDGSGHVIAANSLFERCAPGLTIGPKDAVRFLQPTARRLFETATAMSDRDEKIVRSIPIAGCSDAPPYIVHLAPLREAAHDLFGRAEWLLFATFRSAGPTLTAELLETLFDLTAAEARVVRSLIAGGSVVEIAQELSVQTNTVRAHLKSVFNKTGVRRQAELASLLARTVGALALGW